MNTSLDIKKIYELIDLYKYASVDGERVEIIVTPYEKDGKWDNSKRVLTIGLQGGFSRDRDTFVIENAEEFDQKILPLLVSYYEQDDALGKWYIVTPEIENTTNKGVSHTESGNALYLESFDKEIYEELTESKEKVEENTIYTKVKLNDQEKIWDEIFLYAKKRRIEQDYYSKSLSDEQKSLVYNFVVNLSNERKINTTFSRNSLESTENYIKEVFKDKDKLIGLGLTDELINTLNNDVEITRLAKLVTAEKRIRRRVDVNNPVIKEKIDFAISELEKVDYYELRNASLVQFSNGIFTSNKPSAIQKLKANYEENSNYASYCDEILSYLNTKAKCNNRVVETKVETPKVIVNDSLNNNNYIVDSYEKLNEIIDLVRYGKLDDERYEIIVEPDRLNTSEVIVRISLLDGVSRSDSYMFKFTDKVLFDNEFARILENIRKEDPNFYSTINYLDVPGLGLVKHALHESRDGNETLIKYADDGLGYPHSTKVVEEKKNEELDEDLLKKLSLLEEQINDEARKQDEQVALDTTVSFDKLHEYVKTYKIDNSMGELKLYRRDTGEEYIPSTPYEKANVEFAIYWGVSAGIEENKDDVVIGEKYAFNEENKKLFDLLDVQFRESVKRGIPVDIESLKTQFEISGVKWADAIFTRLFKNIYYVDYVKKYYECSLGKTKDNSEIKVSQKEPLFDEKGMNTLISKLYDLYNNQDISLLELESNLKNLETEINRYISLRDELEKKSQLDPEQYYSDYLKYINLCTEISSVKEDLDIKLEEMRSKEKEQQKIDLSLEDKELVEYLKLSLLRDKVTLSPTHLARIEELKSNEKVLGLEIANHNVLDATYKLSLIEDKESAEYKLLERQLNDKKEALQSLRSVYRKELADAIKENENDELLKGAHDQAKRIVARNEYDQIVESSKVEARRIVEKEEHNKLLEGAYQEAKRIVEKEEHDKLLEGAHDQATRLIQNSQEEDKIDTQKTLEPQKEPLSEERKNALINIRDTLFEVVKQNEEQPKVPEVVEIEDAVEVVDTYATVDQPTTIKLFFDKNTPDVADLIISNGSNENETVMYQRTFDKDKIVKDIIPVVCELYAKDNTPYYNKTFDVPNTNRGGLIVIGTNEKTFQISNAEKEIVSLCEKYINDNLIKNKKEEEQKAR